LFYDFLTANEREKKRGGGEGGGGERK